MFCLCFCMSEVISSFKSLKAVSQVFVLLMLFAVLGTLVGVFVLCGPSC